LAKTGASGQQMKEGIGINKSLTALGNCIEKLALRAKKVTGKEVHVPYRSDTQQTAAAHHSGKHSRSTDGRTVSQPDGGTGRRKRTEEEWTRRESKRGREENSGERGDCSVD